jgi:hypothetical protein
MLLCFSYQVRKTIHNSTYALKTSWNVCLPSKRNCLEKSSFFIEIRFFKSRCMDSQNWFTVIQAKRDTKQRLRGKILTFATWTLFSQNFFSWKAGITSRYYSKVFASGDAHCSGTRSKATLSKCTTFISFCFSYQNIGWHPTQNLDHNTSIWSLSFKQKKIHEKSVPVAKVTIFLLRHGLYLYFGLNHSNISADNPYPLSVKIISLWKTKIFPSGFVCWIGTHSKKCLRGILNDVASYSLGTRSKTDHDWIFTSWSFSGKVSQNREGHSRKLFFSLFPKHNRQVVLFYVIGKCATDFELVDTDQFCSKFWT